MRDRRRGPPDLSVLHVLDTDGYAGRESVVHRLAAAQAEAGLDVRVVAVVEEGRDEPPFPEMARADGVPVDVVALPGRAYLTEGRRVADLLRGHRADVAHTHGYRPDVVGAVAARAVGVATVSTVHGFIGGGLRNRLYEWMQSWSLRRFDRVVGVSAGVARELLGRGVPAGRVRVVRNAWAGSDDELVARDEARDRLGVERDAFHIGWVGRLSREKGLDVLLDALRSSEASDVCLSVVGAGPEEAELRRRAQRLPRGVDVHWHGRIERASRLFRAFDVLVLSSRSEGTPMVLLEAMGAGVPVVSTEVGGVPDVISTDEGWLVPAEDPGSLWSAVAEVRRHPRAAADRAAAAADRLERRFGRDEWVSRYDEVYREAVEQAAPGG